VEYNQYYNVQHWKIENKSVSEISASQLAPGNFPYDIEVVAENLTIPWSLDISNEGKIYVTERTGAIRVIEDGVLNPQPMFTFGPPFTHTAEGGLLGIALDPDFDKNRFIYVFHTYMEGDQIFNKVVRLIEKNNRAEIDQVLLDQLPGGQVHNGGRIKIGPDNKLYIATGDAGKAVLAQDLSSNAGKILRINLDGTIPQDNPFEDSPIYSYGLRNPQGMAWNSNGQLYASDHGDSGNDEINIINPGRNYGWPLVEGEEHLEDVRTEIPLVFSEKETWAPSGIAYMSKGPWQGKLLAASLRGQQLLAFTLDDEGMGVEQVDSWLWNQYGRLREVVISDDGSIYLTTSNRDGRGNPQRGDDKIFRLVPKNV
jgi:glucose/arabinose dehydrogenase